MANRRWLCQPETVGCQTIARERIIEKSVVVPAAIEDVWEAWTTDVGIRRWLLDDSHIELRVGGPYEWYFHDADSAPPGERGSEGCQVIGFQAPSLLTFTWNAPPHLPVARAQRTVCLLRLREAGSDQTEVSFAELGWGEGQVWDEAYAYFDAAWGRVLDRLAAHFAGAAELPEA